MIKLMIATAGLMMLAAAPLPVPPMPPQLTPFETLAPVARSDVDPPSDIAWGPNLKLRTFDRQSFEQNVNGGYLPSSHYENKEDRKAIQTPGLSITIPLK
jgi:hypothetical protein